MRERRFGCDNENGKSKGRDHPLILPESTVHAIRVFAAFISSMQQAMTEPLVLMVTGVSCMVALEVEGSSSSAGLRLLLCMCLLARLTPVVNTPPGDVESIVTFGKVKTPSAQSVLHVAVERRDTLVGMETPPPSGPLEAFLAGNIAATANAPISELKPLTKVEKG